MFSENDFEYDISYVFEIIFARFELFILESFRSTLWINNSVKNHLCKTT